LYRLEKVTNDGMASMDRYPGLEGVEYCPVSIGAKLIADRWSLLIVRELLQGATRFSEIHRGLPGLSKSLLSSRLRSLARQGLVARCSDNATGTYHLTPAGADLRQVILAIGTWTVRWRFPPPSSAEGDSALLLWRLFQSLRFEQLPPRRVTVELTFGDTTPNRGWLVLDGAHSSLCMEPPGDDIDVVVRGSVDAWLSIWFRHRSYAEVVRAGELTLQGSPQLTAQLPRWFGTSAFAESVAAGRVDPGVEFA
jgi:DNA-binding HxlR family transcriptional regulator